MNKYNILTLVIHSFCDVNLLVRQTWSILGPN